MGQQKSAGGVHDLDQAVPPIAFVRITEVDVPEQVVDEGVQQGFLVREVAVEAFGITPSSVASRRMVSRSTPSMSAIRRAAISTDSRDRPARWPALRCGGLQG